MFLSVLIFLPQLQQAKASDFATITLNLFLADDSTHIDSTAAVLYNSLGNKIDSVQVSGNQVVFSGLSTTSVHQTDGNIPEGYQLLQNYPNPFNPTTRIGFQIPKAGPVSLEVYNILGQEETSLKMRLGAGIHEVEYTPGGAVGIRFYRIKTDNFSQTKKMVDLGGSGGQASLRLINSNGERPVNSIPAPNDVIQAIAKTLGSNYSVRILNLSSTTPPIVDMVIQIMNLVKDTTINVYISRKYLSFDEMKNKLTSAQNGDTVFIPAGICNIPSEIRIDNNITIKGAGVDKTIFYGAGGTGAGILEIVGHNDNASLSITGITFQFPDDNRGSYCLRIYGTMSNFRIWNCRFKNTYGRGIWVLTNEYGVIDHCQFEDHYISILVERDDGGLSWTSPQPIGTGDAVFVEDCNFTTSTGSHMTAMDGNAGGRFVFRYNTINFTMSENSIPGITVHGSQNPITDLGTFSAEIYNNVINQTSACYGIYIFGGRGVVFNNTMTGSIIMPICFSDYNSFNANDYSDKTSDAIKCKTYPAFHQINNYYAWNNTCAGNLVTDGNPLPYVQDRGLDRDHIQKDRDYFDAEMPGYVPYTYPHPLVK